MMKRMSQVVLILSTILFSWLMMQALHEAGHVLGAMLSGGTVRRVVLHPLTISRTDLELNPQPLFVVWMGPILGVILPVLIWKFFVAMKWSGAFVLRFLVGFCLIANGAQIAGGSFGGIGDCGEMLRHGSAMWQLWLFGALTIPLGFWVWNGEGKHFGLANANGEVNSRVATITLITALLTIALAWFLGGETS